MSHARPLLPRPEPVQDEASLDRGLRQRSGIRGARRPLGAPRSDDRPIEAATPTALPGKKAPSASESRRPGFPATLSGASHRPQRQSRRRFPPALTTISVIGHSADYGAVWTTARPEFAVGLRYVHASDRVRSGSLLPERKRQFAKPSLHPVRLDPRSPDDPRPARPCRSGTGHRRAPECPRG